MNFANNKKFKFGALAVCFTAAVIAVVVILNVIVSAISAKYMLSYISLGKGATYGTSERSYELIDMIDGENSITVYFLADSERLTSSAAGSFNTSSSLWGMKNIYTVAKELEGRYSFIKVEHIDLNNEPEKIKAVYGEEHKDVYNSTTFTVAHVIVKNDTYSKDSNGEYILDTITGEKIPESFIKTYSRNDFYAGNQQGYLNSLCSDYKLTAAILSVCYTNARAYFLKGHGEQIGSTDNDYSYATGLKTLFEDAGFITDKIDLSEETPNDSGLAVMIIFAPKTDISSGDEFSSSRVSEKEKIKNFLSSENHHLMIFLDQSKAELENLESLANDFGIGIESAKVRDSGAASISVDGYTLAGVPTENSVTERVENKSAKVIFESARVLTYDKSKGAAGIIELPKSASPDGKVSYTDDADTALLAFSRNESGSTVTVTSASFASIYNIYTGVYSNRDIALSLMYEMGKETLPSGIEIKALNSAELDITKSEATVWTVIVSALVPLIVAAIGTAVYYRRRHS